MQISLKPEQEKFILEKLKQGKYQSIDELLALAFQLLEEHDYKEKQLLELRENIAAGKEQIRQGKVVDGELVFQQLQEKIFGLHKTIRWELPTLLLLRISV